MYRRDTPPEGWYTAKTAKRKLGNITDGKLRSLVDRGVIERWEPTGSKYGFYKIDDIIELADKWKTETIDGAHFQPATAKDMPETVKLIIKIFGGGDTSAKRIAWLERNPESAFIVKSQGRVVGHIAILPLTEEKMQELFNKDSYATGNIEVEDILPYKVGKSVNLYLLSMCSDDAGTSTVNRALWGQVLVRGLFHHIEDLGRRGIPIKLVASRSSLPDGIKLMRHIGFWEMEPYGSRKNFIIEIERSGLDFCMKHKAAYAEWQKENISNSRQVL